MSYNKKISLKIINNSTVPLPITILDGHTTNDTNSNDTVLVSWDISGETFSVGTVILNTTIPITRDLVTPNIKGVVEALNTMGVGYFTYVGDVVYATYLTNNSVITASLQIGDFTFFIGSGFDAKVWDIILIPANQGFWVVGEYLNYNALSNNRIITLQSNGTYDSSFGSGANGLVASISRQSTDKYIITGSFTNVLGLAVNQIARMTPSSVDPSFLQGTGFPFGANTSAVQTDDKIICGGTFSGYNGNASKGLCRLNADGTFDGTFVVGTGAQGLGGVNSIAIQPDGKILIAGAFTTYNSVVVNQIARINTDGSLDATFLAGTGAGFSGGTPQSVTVLSNGKIMVTGAFNDFDGNSVFGVAQLNTDGTFDPSFFFLFTSYTTISCFAEQTDGKYLFGGAFTDYNGYTLQNLVRTTNAGVYDSTLVQGTSFVGAGLTKILIQPDEKIVLGGLITSYNGVAYNNILRILPNGSSDTQSTP